MRVHSGVFGRRAVDWRILFALVVLMPPQLASQALADRLAINGFRDSLRVIRDTGILRALEHQQRADVDKGRGNPLASLRLGFVQLRRGELDQNRGVFADADHTFDGVVVSHLDWPTAWLGRGLARLNEAGNRSAARNVVQSFLSGDRIADAAVDIANSAIADSQYVDGLLQLCKLALRDYAPGHLRAALLALRRVAAEPVARNPAVQLERVRIERIVGNHDSAWHIAVSLLARQPANAEVLMEDGHVTLARGDGSGAESWFRGLALADSGALRLYRDDLHLILPDSVLRRFDAASGVERADIVRDFFAVDEFGQGRSVTERLREHYRRLDHSRETFAVPAMRFRADIAAALEPNDREMDERGLVWVLHGAPDDHTYLNMLGAPPNESWHYRGDDGGEMLFHFVKTDETLGYQRVPSLFDILAMTRALQATGHGDVKAMAARGEAVETYGASWTAQTVQDMLYSREAMSPTYGRILSHGKNSALRLQAAERATGDSSMLRGETRTARYELPLDAQLDAVAVGSDSAGQLLQVAFAIPGTSLYASPTVRPVVYPITMRVSVIRRGTGQVVAAIDTLRRFIASEPVPENGTLFGRLPIRVPPGDYTVRMALESPSRGVMSPRQVIRVAGTGADSIDLSDLALGARTVRLWWRTPRGDSAWINPSRTFRVSEPMQLYFEVFGLAVGTQYKSELRVLKAGDQSSQLAIAYTATSVTTPDPSHRELDLGRLAPGSYELQVTVSTASGAKAIRRGEFTVVK